MVSPRSFRAKLKKKIMANEEKIVTTVPAIARYVSIILVDFSIKVGYAPTVEAMKELRASIAADIRRGGLDRTKESYSDQREILSVLESVQKQKEEDNSRSSKNPD